MSEAAWNVTCLLCGYQGDAHECGSSSCLGASCGYQHALRRRLAAAEDERRKVVAEVVAKARERERELRIVAEKMGGAFEARANDHAELATAVEAMAGHAGDKHATPPEERISLDELTERISERCEDARLNYRKYIRPDCEQMDFNGFLAGIVCLCQGDAGTLATTTLAGGKGD